MQLNGTICDSAECINLSRLSPFSHLKCCQTIRVLRSDEPVAMETHSGVLTCSIKHTLSATQHFHLSAVFRLIAYCRGLAPIIPMLIDKKMIDSLFFFLLGCTAGLFFFLNEQSDPLTVLTCCSLHSCFCFLACGKEEGKERKKKREVYQLSCFSLPTHLLLILFLPFCGMAVNTFSQFIVIH